MHCRTRVKRTAPAATHRGYSVRGFKARPVRGDYWMNTSGFRPHAPRLPTDAQLRALRELLFKSDIRRRTRSPLAYAFALAKSTATHSRLRGTPRSHSKQCLVAKAAWRRRVAAAPPTRNERPSESFANHEMQESHEMIPSGGLFDVVVCLGSGRASRGGLAPGFVFQRAHNGVTSCQDAARKGHKRAINGPKGNLGRTIRTEPKRKTSGSTGLGEEYWRFGARFVAAQDHFAWFSAAASGGGTLDLLSDLG